MEGAYFDVKNYEATLSETSVHLRVDNTATLTWINKQPPPNQNVLYFWKFCAAKIIGVHASYISSSRNKVADKESIKLTDNLEWSLKGKFFEKIVGNFGPVATDSCTSSVNCKASLYYSYTHEPEAIEIDAFSYYCSNENFYTFQPLTLISKALSKIETEMAAGVLIVFLFTTSSWFTQLLRLLIHESLSVPKSNTCFYSLYRRMTMSQKMQP